MANFNIDVNASIDAAAKSTGGNGTADAGKLLEFDANGGARFGDYNGSYVGLSDNSGQTPVDAYSDTGNTTIVAINGGGGAALQASSNNGGHAIVASNNSSIDEALHAFNIDPTKVGDIARFTNVDIEGVEIKNDGGLQWTSATGAGTTRTNLGLAALALQGDGDKGDITVSNNGATWNINADAVGTTELNDVAVSTRKIADNAVTFAKLQDIATNHLIGRHTAGNGDPQEINIDGGLELNGANIRRSALTGDVTASAGSNSTTIANDAVTNAKLANMAEATIKGRQAGSGTGDPEDLTATQARTALALGTAALVDTGTGAANVPTITQADARYLTPFAYSLLPAWTVGTQATTSVTLADVTDTELTVPSAGMYEFEYRFTYDANATTTGAGFSARNTVGGTVDYGTLEIGLDTQSGDRSTFRGGLQTSLSAASSRATTVNTGIVRGRAIFNAASAVRLQFRTEIATTTTITVTDVIGFIRRVA